MGRGKKKCPSGYRGNKPKLEWRVKLKLPADVPSTAASPPPWIELPRDLTANILQRLGPIEMLNNAQKVCKTWQSVCKDPLMWRVIDIKNVGAQEEMPYDLNSLCYHAVDLSQGQLIDINIELFGTDDLLYYISERSSQLKRLRLVSRDYEITDQVLSEAIKNLPKLEELHLFFIYSNRDLDIETIGQACPMLKSFTFHNHGYKIPFVELNDKHAFAVAETMPNVRHLRLSGNRMTNDGLEAILIGCPKLDSLDLRECFNVDLSDISGGDIGKRCSHLIKDLKGPDASTADYEFDGIICMNEDESLNYDDYSDGYSYSYSIGDYDDFTNPFNDDYLSDSDALLFQHLTLSDEFDGDFFF